MTACFALNSAVWAQGNFPTAPFAPPDPSISAVVQELVVTARRPGPALFTVRRGASTVIVLGAVTPLPHMLAWDTVRVERALDGANAVLLPPQGRIGVLDALGILFHAGDLKLARGQTLSGLMSADEKKRFENLRAQIHTGQGRYEGLKPGVAGFLLLSDFRKAAGLSAAKPASSVERLAKARNVPVRPLGEVRVGQAFKAFTHLTPEQDRACLDAALSDTEREAQHAPETARAWADGDLRAVRANYHGALFEKCILAAPSLQAVLDKGVAEGIAAVDAALARPGKTVVVTDLSFLLQANGLLDQLRAKGDAVSMPPE